MPQQITAGVVQQQGWPDKTKSLAATEEAVRGVAADGAQLILLQELHATHYPAQLEDVDAFDLAEELDGPTATRLADLARELDVVLVGSIFERRAAGVYHNTALVFDRADGLAGIYRKMHIPDDPNYYEKYYFAPGDPDGFQPIPTSLGTLGVLVCWDQWFPEAARLMALAGADYLLYPTAIGWIETFGAEERQRQKEAWTLIQQSHAVANGIPVLVANRTGREPDPSGNTAGIQFWGGSFIAGPQGEMLAHAGSDEPANLLATLDRGHAERVRRTYPYLRDRRIDAYSDLTRRFRDR
jgi:N-carbamoylputrescine amidase